MAPLQAAAPAGGEAGLAVFALVGLLGGAHCLGMCGPLVTLYADRMGGDGPVGFSEIRQHLLFNLGRTASYALIGALIGALGTVLYDAAGVAAVADDADGAFCCRGCPEVARTLDEALSARRVTTRPARRR
ncbi:hypothetical protein C475_12130 [Halosimplex carlsbadense 2-9-1]|uniref:Urease accessory protein UreH-like transmembrane domain-containing protein n=1 Tax=Halosimplex carlsbadense 2-9-1 TaxID=797114 RepID=M0CNZ7_9EURY|nr:hypothetical protein C475_12130 [Halosimplex carlsbadense 2-9-1]